MRHIYPYLSGSKVLLTVLVLFGLLNVSHAQKGVITGKITIQQDGTPLSRATVKISDTNKGALSDLNGDYRIQNLEEGAYTLVVSYLTFETKEVLVNVVAGEVLRVDISMIPQAFVGEEVVISAQAKGQVQAINQQLSSESMVNIVSADRIQELPDVNAAEAIARLPGVAINRSGGEGQKVVIRGLDPKFAAITVNGVSLPSNSSTDRSVDLSLISPELLDGIEVFKSPLPNMDAEAIGGTVNLRLRKAPKDWRILAKGLGGYNDLNNDFRDHKGVLQVSNRIFNDKVGFVYQGSIERFNRGGDIQISNWRQGATDSLGVTEILGNSLRFEDRQEIRKRWNSSLSLDYDLGKSSFSFFGLYSKTERNRFNRQDRYIPSEPGLEFWGTGIDNSLDLYSLSVSGEHAVGPLTVDWTLSNSRSLGQTPYNFTMRFVDYRNLFDPDLNPDGNPNTFFTAAQSDLSRTYLFSANQQNTRTEERTQTAVLNIELPFKLSEKINGYIRVGGKYKGIDRNRKAEELAEDFYFLAASEATRAIEQFDGDLIFNPDNNKLISMLSFTEEENSIQFFNDEGKDVGLQASLDPDLVRNWYEQQEPILNEDRSAIVDNYEVEEEVMAGYFMMRLNLGKKLYILPGFRFEQSDNIYNSGISSINGRYGVNGFFRDSTTTQNYGEFLPHFHLKYQPVEWFDIRASYAQTLARPDFLFITPRSQIDDNNVTITTGNPNLRFAKAQNYDLLFSAYKGTLGLVTVGFFYKQIDNLFYPWRTNLFDQEIADEAGWGQYRGYELRSFINSAESSVYGVEVDLQSSLNFLPKPFNRLVLNVNYSRLYSQTEVFFLTSETRLIIPVPPIFETTFTNSAREVNMPSQPPHVFRLSLGYDYKKFSARVSGAFQGTKAETYSSNKDFDSFTLAFWRWDASAKQEIGKNWSVFLNLNNFTNQQDITFIRDEVYRNRTETYGFTATMGIQFKFNQATNN